MYEYIRGLGQDRSTPEGLQETLHLPTNDSTPPRPIRSNSNYQRTGTRAIDNPTTVNVLQKVPNEAINSTPSQSPELERDQARALTARHSREI